MQERPPVIFRIFGADTHKRPKTAFSGEGKMAPDNRLLQMSRLGQSVWLDAAGRSLILSGELKRLSELGIRGLTSNPAIFREAVSSDPLYDAVIRELRSYGLGSFEIYDDLTSRDIQAAANMFLPLHQATEGSDGYVSVGINPHLSADTQASIDEARRLAAKIGRPNVMVQIPATDHGFPAMERLIAEGLNVNATLVFCPRQHEGVMNAYLNGIKSLLKSGKDPRKVHSVASVLVGVVDETVDDLIEGLVRPMPDEMHKRDLRELKNKAAMANAAVIYRRFREVFSGEQFRQIAQEGAGIQRIVWTSMSPSDPSIPLTRYVNELMAKDTVCAVPERVLEAFIVQDQVRETSGLEQKDVEQVLGRLRRLWIDVNEICDRLLEDGVSASRKSFDDLLAVIAAKAKQH